MDDPQLWEHTISLAAEPASAARAREFVRLLLAEHALGALEDEICLVASELVTNALVHARTSMDVSLSRAAEELTLTVADSSTLMPAAANRGTMELSGRGLLIVQMLSQHWGVTRGADAKSVWATFAARQAPSLAGP